MLDGRQYLIHLLGRQLQHPLALLRQRTGCRPRRGPRDGLAQLAGALGCLCRWLHEAVDITDRHGE